MALPSGAYAPRDPASVLYRVVWEHYESFRAESACLRDGEGLPRFVEDEFRAFLRCGWHAGGFARFVCTRCRQERLVAFSCKGRGFCPSCGGRRMTERAAHLVDHVWPDVPVRQWVLTLPRRVRYLLAWRHDLCTAVAGSCTGPCSGTCGRGRGRAGWGRPAAARSSSCSAFHPTAHSPRSGGPGFGGALNLNVHLHALVLDGVFARGTDGRLRFHRALAPTAADVADVLAAIVPAVRARLAQHGVDDEGGRGADRFVEAAPLLAGLAAASAQGALVVGGVPGRRPERLGEGGREEGGRQPTPRGPRPRMPVGRGSTCMRASRSRPTGRAWSVSVGTRCARR
jgi:hypothetical protein